MHRPRRVGASSAQRKSLSKILPHFAGRHESQGKKPRLYRENFTPEECQELDRNPPLSAVSELCVLRILLARVLRALRKIKPTLEHHYKNLVVFSQVGCTMASLARFQHRLDGPPPDPFLDALAQMDADPL
jgi:hypothetical protein